MSNTVARASSAFLDLDIGGAPSLSTPTYSLVPKLTEISLHPEAPELFPPTHSSSSWIYHTKHMTIDLGRRLWRTSSPAYGLNDKIEGTVQISGHRPDHIDAIKVTLEGTLLTSVLGDGGTTRSSSQFLSRTTSIALPPHPTNGDEYPFCISIPPELTVHGSTAMTPPSFYRFYMGVTGEISYALKISMTRHGSRKAFQPHESKTIPILYFPKTRPSDPPLVTIPKPPSERELHFSSPNVHISEHVDTYPLAPQWACSSSHTKPPSTGLEPFKKSVFFSIPAPQSFGSGEPIPFFLSLVFPDSPAQAAMYAKNIRVQLTKRLTVRPVKSALRKLFTFQNSRTSTPIHSRFNTPDTSDDEGDDDHGSSISSPSGSKSPSPSAADLDMYAEPVMRQWPLTFAQLQTQSEYSEGVYLIRGWIPAGELGRGCSWKIGHLAELQYFLHVEVDAPVHMGEHLPAFRLEKEIEITTDCWETMNRELQSMGGVPTPALGLEQCLLEKEMYASQ